MKLNILSLFFVFLFSLSINGAEINTKWIELIQSGLGNYGQDQLEIKNLGRDEIKVYNWVQLQVCVVGENGISYIETPNPVTGNWISPLPELVKIKPGEKIKLGVSGYLYKSQIMHWNDLELKIKDDNARIVGYIIIDDESKKSLLNGKFIIDKNVIK